MKPAHRIFIFIIGITLAYACNPNPWEVDTSAIDYQPDLKRFEQSFFSLGADGLDSADWGILESQFPKMLPLYVEGVLQMGAWNSSTTRNELNQLLSNKDIQALYHDVLAKFPEGELQPQKRELEEALKNYAHYFPGQALPELYTLMSMFSYNIIIDEGVLGISLDMYLGSEYKFYPSTSIPKYRFKNFEPEFMVSDALKAFLIAEFDQGGGQTLLEQMVFFGKIAYLQKAFLPGVEENMYFNYNPEELAWCEDNESEIWFHFVDMELLYSTETAQIRKYMDDAPFIPGFPEGSSARVGKWIGYQVVNAYMNEHPETSLQDLMSDQDANKFLIKSKYKPRR